MIHLAPSQPLSLAFIPACQALARHVAAINISERPAGLKESEDALCRPFSDRGWVYGAAVHSDCALPPAEPQREEEEDLPISRLTSSAILPKCPF